VLQEIEMNTRTLFTAALVALSLAGPQVSSAAGQTPLAADSAAVFIGDWNVAVQADPPVNIKVNLTNNNGILTAFVTGAEGTVTKVEDISRDSEGLVLKYITSLQGQTLPIKITFTPETHTGNLVASIDVAEGLATFPGVVTSAERE
jgi:hypothetical protein